MAAPQTFDEQLTSSSKIALDWASWLAADRGAKSPAQTASSSVAVAAEADSLDLLLGIMLAHPAESEPRQLLDHFAIPIGALHAERERLAKAQEDRKALEAVQVADLGNA